ncbi:MAG TPA: hypothetical protein VFL80_08000 [Thermoanaerobaculia bacterium]|nr:hypothetical protein [Thermoanaerobaculia bacterium]
MKRFRSYVVMAAVLLTVAGVTFAASSASLTVRPAEMKDGETKTFTDDGKTITIRREGNTTHVKIEGAGETRNLTITRGGDGAIRIDRDGKTRTHITSPERPRIVIDGLPFAPDAFVAPHARLIPKAKLRTSFVCPKDHTTLVVPEENAEQSFKCPVDGTEMEKRKGRGYSFFFDDNLLETEEL